MRQLKCLIIMTSKRKIGDDEKERTKNGRRTVVKRKIQRVR